MSGWVIAGVLGLATIAAVAVVCRVTNAVERWSARRAKRRAERRAAERIAQLIERTRAAQRQPEGGRHRVQLGPVGMAPGSARPDGSRLFEEQTTVLSPDDQPPSSKPRPHHRNERPV